MKYLMIDSQSQRENLSGWHKKGLGNLSFMGYFWAETKSHIFQGGKQFHKE